LSSLSSSFPVRSRKPIRVRKERAVRTFVWIIEISSVGVCRFKM
jgi:hypothetical protein